PRLRGTFLLAAIHVGEPDTVYIANWYQPCYVAVGDDEAMFVSSRRGLMHVVDVMDRVFQPPKNSVIKLTRDGVEVEVMDRGRSIPWMQMNRFEARRLILAKLEEAGRLDLRQLFNALHPEGWGKVFGISPEEWKRHRRNGVYVRNPYFELLEELVADGELQESIDPRTEGGFAGCPRFSYALS
ncbi:MAG: hypothetical protein GTN93_27385, partial [Anaerolineae bacterium]|nr:hypothetical protein [Anaerolineae bacterium]NIQ81753.1 hypothetical protein [Anaerolineae bacterium]